MALGTATPLSTASVALARQETPPVRCAGAEFNFPVSAGTIGWLWKQPSTDVGEDNETIIDRAGIDVYGSGGYGARIFAPGPGTVNRKNAGGFHVIDEEGDVDYYIAHLHEMQVDDGDQVQDG